MVKSSKCHTYVVHTYVISWRKVRMCTSIRGRPCKRVTQTRGGTARPHLWNFARPLNSFILYLNGLASVCLLYTFRRLLFCNCARPLNVCKSAHMESLIAPRFQQNLACNSCRHYPAADELPRLLEPPSLGPPHPGSEKWHVCGGGAFGGVWGLARLPTERHTCHILPPSEIDLGLFWADFAGSGGKHLFHRIG